MEVYNKEEFEKLKTKYDKNYIVIAKIVKPHALDGEVKIEVYSDEENPFEIYEDTYMKIDGIYTKVYIEVVNSLHGKIIGYIYDEREDGKYYPYIESKKDFDEKMLRGLEIYIEKEALKDLEDDEYYITDLYGMDVKYEDGECLGKVEEVLTNAVTPLIQVDSEKVYGKTILIPFVDEYVTKVQKEEKVILVNRENLKGIVEVGF